MSVRREGIGVETVNEGRCEIAARAGVARACGKAPDAAPGNVSRGSAGPDSVSRADEAQVRTANENEDFGSKPADEIRDDRIS
jgi:hypothetical protein